MGLTINWKGLGEKRSRPDRGTVTEFVRRNRHNQLNISSEVIRCLSRDSNREDPEYKSRALPLRKPAWFLAFKATLQHSDNALIEEQVQLSL
jgi:hypothetical protein